MTTLKPLPVVSQAAAMVCCCETCAYFARAPGEPDHRARVIPMLATCNAVAGWRTKSARDAALRETNAANKCPHHAPLPAPVQCCATCAAYRPDDRMRPCIAARTVSADGLRRFTLMPDQVNACPFFDPWREISQ